MYDWMTLLYSRIWHNTANKLQLLKKATATEQQRKNKPMEKRLNLQLPEGACGGKKNWVNIGKSYKVSGIR